MPRFSGRPKTDRLMLWIRTVDLDGAVSEYLVENSLETLDAFVMGTLLEAESPKLVPRTRREPIFLDCSRLVEAKVLGTFNTKRRIAERRLR